MGLEVEVVGDTNKFDVICIGGGVAGMTASSIVTQSGLKSCFLEKDVPGGKIMHLGTIHNFGGSEINGPDLGLSIFKQATEEVKTNYVYGDVQSIRPKNDLFYIYTADGQTWEAKAIIIATGTINNKLNVEGEDKYNTKGVSYCVLCDASLAKDKEVVIVGQSTHLDVLKQQAKKVTTLSANEVKSIQGNGETVTGIVKKDGSIINCDFVFIENGYKPNIDFLPVDITTDEKQQIIVDSTMSSPYFNGVFACGDCINSDIKMIQPAMQQAALAADSAVKYVKSKKW